MSLSLLRNDGRKPLELRPIEFTPNYLKYPYGSTLVRWGDNIILTAATVSDTVPPFCVPLEQGWITAEYRLLPASTSTRNPNISSSRSIEIKRIIGRALRAGVDLKSLKGLSIIIDCEVLQADGGTRVACITGGFISLVWALKRLYDESALQYKPLRGVITAISGAVIKGELYADPNFLEDSSADMDINLAFNDKGEVVELQLTAEGSPLPLNTLMEHVNQLMNIGDRVRKLQVENFPEDWEKLLLKI